MPPILHLGMTWPLPEQLIRQFAASVKRLIVIEELDPFIEEAVRLMGLPAEGKSIFPILGEFNPRIVRESAIQAGLLPESEHVPHRGNRSWPVARSPAGALPRLPAPRRLLCAEQAQSAGQWRYRLLHPGLIAPLSAIHSCGCMGAGIAVAHGALKAGSSERQVAVIGNSTFFHTGIPALLDVVYNNSPVITIIMDNRITGMTGHQENPGTGRTLQGETAVQVELEPLVKALGVKHVRTVPAFEVEQIEKTLKEFLKLDEPSVLITLEPCALLPEARKKWKPLEVLSEPCNGCGLCFRVGCPAILKSEELDARYQRPKALIDAQLCTGCEVCAQVCPRDAITFRPD